MHRWTSQGSLSSSSTTFESDLERRLQEQRETAQLREQQLQDQLTAAESQMVIAAQASTEAEVVIVNSEAGEPDALVRNASSALRGKGFKLMKPKIPKPRGKVTQVWRILRQHGIDEKDYRLMKVSIQQHHMISRCI